MREQPVLIPDELEEAIEALQRDQSEPMSLDAVVREALEDYLAARGYLPRRRVLQITPAPKGDGDPLGSVEHDRLFSESWER